MANQIEGYLPVVQSDGLNTAKNVSFTGAVTMSGAVTHSGALFTSSSVNLVPPSGTVVVIGDYATANIDLLVAGSVTINAQRGQAWTPSLSMGSGSTFVFTLRNSRITAGGIVLTSLSSGGNSTGAPIISTINTSAGVATISIGNASTASILNGSVIVNFVVIN